MARVGIDLDGVCYDFAASLRQYLHAGAVSRYAALPVPTSEGCVDCKANYPDPQRWAFYEDWGMDLIAFQRRVKKGVEAGVVFGWGDPHPGTKEALQRLTDAGHEVVIVTDRVGLGGQAAKNVTVAWLKRHEIPYHELHFDSDKTLYECDYFIEDKLENYDALDAAGCKVYLWNRPWNRPTPARNYRRVYSWEEFLNSVEIEQYAKLSLGRVTPAPVGVVRVTSETGGQKEQKMARLGSLDPAALLEVAKVAGFGERKYSRLNYMKGYDWSLTFDAGMRHRLAFWNGEDLDPESGLPHLAHAAWHDLCLLTFFMKELGTDDRYEKPEEEDQEGAA